MVDKDQAHNATTIADLKAGDFFKYDEEGPLYTVCSFGGELSLVNLFDGTCSPRYWDDPKLAVIIIPRSLIFKDGFENLKLVRVS